MAADTNWALDGKPWPAPFIHDANLNDVWWIDERVAWAVGDRGAVFQSVDGGASWKIAPVQVDGNLNSVFFANAQRGWIAGGSVDPMANSSSGTLLRTADGGATWQTVKLTNLSQIHHLDVSIEDQLFCLTDPSALFPSGAFLSADAGRSWQTRSLHGTGPVSELLGVLGHLPGRPTRPVDLRSQRFNAGATDCFGKLLPTDGARSIGLTGHGRVLVSDNLGRTWQPLPLPPGIANYIHFHAACALGNQLWLAGSPGTTILKSSDLGRTWQVARTGQTLPIRAITFHDPLRGIAVGALGTILTTSDGGSSWRTNKGQGNRLGLLAIVPSPRDFAPELFSYATAIGARSAASFVSTEAQLIGTSDLAANRQRLMANLGPTAVQRLHQALTISGAAGVAGDLGATNETDSMIRLSMAIRIWRPDVVAVPATTATFSQLTQLVQAAVARAADDHPTDESSLVDLAPWSCQVVTVNPQPRGAGIPIATDQPLAGLHASVGGMAHRALVIGWNDRLPDDLRLQVISGNLSASTLLSLIEHSGSSGQARRAVPDKTSDSSNQLAGQRKIITALVRRVTRGGEAGGMMQLGPLIGQLPVSDGSLMLFSAARRFHAAGDVQAGFQSMDLLRQRDPTSGLASAALTERFLLLSSQEFTHHLGRDGQAAANTKRQSRKTPALPISGMPFSGMGIVPEQYAREDPSDPAWVQSQLTPAQQAEPAVRFTLEAVERRTRKPNENRSTYQRLSRAMPTALARRLAAAELWLHGDRTDRCPVPLVKLPSVDEKPLLDGSLNEPIWQLAQPVSLPTTRGLDGEVRLLRDEAFLFVGVRCEVDPGSETATDTTRKRDADLTSHDRIQLQLDVDRDFVTSWDLTIDHRGWASDSCGGDPSWDPRLFIASSRSPNAWIIESAVALEDLGQSATSAAEWGLRISRCLPGHAAQEWPFSEQSNAVWGLLVETNVGGPVSISSQ